MAPDPPRRRWFRYSLRTLFVVIAILAIVLSWVRVQVNWIQQRHAFLERAQFTYYYYEKDASSTPVSLWLFGERAMNAILIHKNQHSSEELATEARRLFPEAVKIQEVPYLADGYMGQRDLYDTTVIDH